MHSPLSPHAGKMERMAEICGSPIDWSILDLGSWICWITPSWISWNWVGQQVSRWHPGTPCSATETVSGRSLAWDDNLWHSIVHAAFMIIGSTTFSASPIPGLPPNLMTKRIHRRIDKWRVVVEMSYRCRGTPKQGAMMEWWGVYLLTSITTRFF